MTQRGFSLIELMVSAAILIVVGALTYVVITASASSSETAQVKSTIEGNLRDVLSMMAAEAQMAAKEDNAALTPPLEGLEIVENPVAGSPIEIAFQVPLDGSGRNWSQRIRYRYVNEDINGNGVLDEGEDLDEDKALSRRVMRIQDANGDGDTTDPGEERIVGAANELSNMQFDLQDGILTVTATAAKWARLGHSTQFAATHTRRVYLLN